MQQFVVTTIVSLTLMFGSTLVLAGEKAPQKWWIWRIRPW